MCMTPFYASTSNDTKSNLDNAHKVWLAYLQMSA